MFNNYENILDYFYVKRDITLNKNYIIKEVIKLGKSVLIDKSSEFAIGAVVLAKKLNNLKQFQISEQLLRSATSIGANIREGRYAQSKKDFTHKMSIALKECHETIYWLKLIVDGKIIDDEETLKLYKSSYDILRMLVSTVNTSKHTKSRKEK